MDALANTWDDIVDALSQNHVPEIFLIVIGVLVIALALSYLDDEESGYYKGFYAVSIVAAAITVVLLATNALPMELDSLIILALGCFTLLSRPFRESYLAIFFSLFILVVVYLALGSVEGVDFLNGFWPKFIIALIVAGIVYAVSSFIEGVVTAFGKLLNWWPLMIVVGALCVLEAALLFTGNGSIITYVKHLFGM